MPTPRNQDKAKFSTKDTKKEWPARRENNKTRIMELFEGKWSKHFKKEGIIIDHILKCKVILQRSHSVKL